MARCRLRQKSRSCCPGVPLCLQFYCLRPESGVTAASTSRPILQASLVIGGTSSGVPSPSFFFYFLVAFMNRRVWSRLLICYYLHSLCTYYLPRQVSGKMDRKKVRPGSGLESRPTGTPIRRLAPSLFDVGTYNDYLDYLRTYISVHT